MCEAEKMFFVFIRGSFIIAHIASISKWECLRSELTDWRQSLEYCSCVCTKAPCGTLEYIKMHSDASFYLLLKAAFPEIDGLTTIANSKFPVMFYMRFLPSQELVHHGDWSTQIDSSLESS